MSASSGHGSPVPHAAGWELVRTIFAQIQQMDDLPKLTTATFIGIMVAITGNVLISLALNLQKLAHKRVEADGHKRRQSGRKGKGVTDVSGNLGRTIHEPSLDERDEERPYTPTPGVELQSSFVMPTEAEFSVPFPLASTQPRNYGTNHCDSEEVCSTSMPKNRRDLVLRLVPTWFRSRKVLSNIKDAPLEAHLLPVGVISEDTPLQPEGRRKTVRKQDSLEEFNETEYLKSKLWYAHDIVFEIDASPNVVKGG